MNMKLFIALTASFISMFAFVGCDGDSEDQSVDYSKAAYGAPTKDATYAMKGSVVWTSETNYYAAYIGEKTIGAKTYKRLKAAYEITNASQVSESSKGMEFWIDGAAGGKISLAGVRQTGTMTATLDAPFEVDLKSPVGEERPVNLTGNIVLDSGGSGSATISGTYKIAGKNETAVIPMGSIGGCLRLTGSGTVSGEFVDDALNGLKVDVEVYYHPTLGLVKWNVPIINSGMGLDESAEYGEPDADGFATIKKVRTIDDANPVYFLSTYDVNKEFDADKTTHAKMLLELRYADDNDAKTLGTLLGSGVSIAFTTVWGQFNYTLIESPVSIFHPEDNGKGMKFYYAYVDQAAKNEPGANGIMYKITVSRPAGMKALRCTARIRYKVIDTAAK